jgi:type IV pilus assembly protein PilA
MNGLGYRFLRRPYRQHIFLEILMSLIVIALLLSFAIREMKAAVAKAEGLGAFSDFTTARAALVESFALGGTWPDRQLFHFECYEKPAVDMDSARGAIDLELPGPCTSHATRRVLSMRPATGASNTTVLWVCGHAAVPEGMQVSGTDATTLSGEELYVACR